MALYDEGAPPSKRLTRRQAEVLGLAACGMTNKEIAAQLGIAVQSVKNHLLNTRRALDALNTAHAVRLAIDLKLINVCGG